MRLIFTLTFVSNFLIACGNPIADKIQEKIFKNEIEIKSDIKKDTLITDLGYKKAIEIMRLIQVKDYSKVRNSFFTPISKQIPEKTLRLYIDKAANLISKYGIPNKDEVINGASFTTINIPEITSETNVELLLISFPMPVTKRNEPPLGMVSISFLPSVGFDKIVGFNVLDNSNRKIIKPDFDKNVKFSLSIDKFKKIRIYNTNKGNDKSLDKKITELEFEQIKSIKRIISLINKSKIEKIETVSDITRYKGNPETISLHLNSYNEFIMPNEMDKPHLLITEILNNEQGVVEKENDWIIIRQFKILTSSYLYYISKGENMELYNELKKLKEYTR